MLDAPDDMAASLSRNEDTREVARGSLVGVTGMASVEEDVGTRTDTIAVSYTHLTLPTIYSV